jgi:Ankyrin repeats (many copies)
MPPVYVEEVQVISTDLNGAKTDEKQSQVTVQVERAVDCDLPPYSEVGGPTNPIEEDATELPEVRHSTKPDFHNFATDFPEADLQASIGTALQLAAENYFRGGAFEKAMSETIHRVATIQTTFHYADSKESSTDNDEPDTDINSRSSVTDLDIVHSGFRHRRASQSRICHKTSATGTLFGTIWLRTTSVQVNSLTGKSVDVVSSFTFFPSWWLTKIGMKHGMEANLLSTPTGWQFNFNPIRAVPDDSPIFNACRRGNVSTVRFLLSEGAASVRDTNSKGWTPLHVSSFLCHNP